LIDLEAEVVRGRILKWIMPSGRRNIFFRKDHFAGCSRLPVDGGVCEGSFRPELGGFSCGAIAYHHTRIQMFLFHLLKYHDLNNSLQYW